MRKADLFAVEGIKVRCTACERLCLLGEGQTGLCGIRKNIGGELYLISYGVASALAIDPIEKKPLYHFHPGSRVLSISTTGCNWMCKYCQNYDISQRREVSGTPLTPEEVVRIALENKVDGISYTYNEPTVFAEYAKDIGILARKNGLFNTYVSNGYQSEVSVPYISSFLDAITVDFKGNANAEFGKKYIGIRDFEPVLRNLLHLKKMGLYLEITDLVVPIPNIGDNVQDARSLARWIFENLGENTPLHFTRFHPDYHMMDVPPTPVETLRAHYKAAKEEGLKFVYIGNVPGDPLENTYCPRCGNPVIERYGFSIVKKQVDSEGRCKFCGESLNIRYS